MYGKQNTHRRNLRHSELHSIWITMTSRNWHNFIGLCNNVLIMAAKQYDYFPLFAQYAHNRHASQTNSNSRTQVYKRTLWYCFYNGNFRDFLALAVGFLTFKTGIPGGKDGSEIIAWNLCCSSLETFNDRVWSGRVTGSKVEGLDPVPCLKWTTARSV